MADPELPLIAVIGPTATGKTDVAIALALALDGEIIGADSRQVYRGMRIGTAQPAPEQLAMVPHHLIGFLGPDKPFGLATYLDLARAAIDDIRARNRTPIIAGGTGQYMLALLEGWTVPRVAPDAGLRAVLEGEAAVVGARALHDRLQAVDPAAAAGIHPHNLRRVIRALEVFQQTGVPISAQQRRSGFTGLAIGLALDRDAVYRRIDARVTIMYADGLLEEVQELQAEGYDRGLRSMGSIGYPEAWALLAGELSVAQAQARTRLTTRRLARRQSAWFRRGDPRIQWLEAARHSTGSEAVALVRRLLASEGKSGR